MPSNFKIPAIGLGTGTVRDEAQLEDTLGKAIEIGYRHFDTAYGYKNEAFIGRALNKWFTSGKLRREDVFVTTKLSRPGVHQDRVEMFMKMSLEKLQLDYVDLYLVHCPIGTKYFGEGSENNYKEFDDFDHLKIWKKMEEQVDAGRTKAIGLSNFNQKQIERIIKSARIRPACLQVELHVDFQQRELVEFCQRNDIVVVAYSPLGAPGAQRFENKSMPAIIHSDVIKTIAGRYKKTPAQIMLRYLLQNIVPIPKSSNPGRMKENFEIFDFEINSTDMKALDGLERGETARLNWFKIVPGVEQHPEYPFKT